jgi:hypothetical protein
MAKEATITIKKIAGRMKVLQVMPYRGSPVYIRQIDDTIFMYDLIYSNQIYSDYLVITPNEGKKKLSKREVNASAGLIFTAACTTIDELIRMAQESLVTNPVAKAPKVKRSVN